ncbi:MAG TPA: hypothetical protein DDW52_13280 [Planctomycetaceae bacterium]|nr:hypothetical protein [Planctomycetaceae bacterium]
MSQLEKNSHPITNSRRDFLKTAAAGAIVTAGAPAALAITDTSKKPASAESMVKVLFDSLSDSQKSKVCFDWNHMDSRRGLLRTRVANNWMVTPQDINSNFYSDEQRDIVRKVFEGMVNPQWVSKFDQQLDDDCGGFGHDQSFAIFGNPHDEKFEFVLTGRHMTLRCDGNSADSVAFGGPIFYGHAPIDDESPDHEDNVFWAQAVQANEVYKMLDGRQRKAAQVKRTPREQAVAFKGKKGDFTGIPVTELSSDQRQELQKTLGALVQPFREADQKEALECLKAQGGLDACHLSFYTDHDIGKDQVWDNWRLEGPAFVWHFRGAPHVHVWVNIADNPKVKLNA